MCEWGEGGGGGLWVHVRGACAYARGREGLREGGREGGVHLAIAVTWNSARGVRALLH